jgi:hypothetical protein
MDILILQIHGLGPVDCTPQVHGPWTEPATCAQLHVHYTRTLQFSTYISTE